MKSEHCSEPRNPLIANVLYKRKLLENWGRGISLMTEECSAKTNLTGIRNLSWPMVL